MKKTIFLALIFLGISLNNFAQTRERTRTERESGDFAERLWYGGGFNLGFSSNSFFGSQFLIGISPQAGYKITEPFSIGPRASVQYSNFSSGGESSNVITWSVGAFTRYKLFWQVFAQLEYEYANDVDRRTVFSTLERFQNDNIYIGGGYNSSQGPRSLGTEIVVLYNVNEDILRSDSPWEFRFGLTYNF